MQGLLIFCLYWWDFLLMITNKRSFYWYIFNTTSRKRSVKINLLHLSDTFSLLPLIFFGTSSFPHWNCKTKPVTNLHLEKNNRLKEKKSKYAFLERWGEIKVVMEGGGGGETKTVHGEYSFTFWKAAASPSKAQNNFCPDPPRTTWVQPWLN